PEWHLPQRLLEVEISRSVVDGIAAEDEQGLDVAGVHRLDEPGKGIVLTAEAVLRPRLDRTREEDRPFLANVAQGVVHQVSEGMDHWRLPVPRQNQCPPSFGLRQVVSHGPGPFLMPRDRFRSPALTEAPPPAED